MFETLLPGHSAGLSVCLDSGIQTPTGGRGCREDGRCLEAAPAAVWGVHFALHFRAHLSRGTLVSQPGFSVWLLPLPSLGKSAGGAPAACVSEFPALTEAAATLCPLVTASPQI